MSHFILEQTFLLPDKEAAKVMSRMLIAGWEIRGAVTSVRYYWHRDQNLVCLLGTQHPKSPGVATAPTDSLSLNTTSGAYRVMIGGDTELVELFDGIKAYDSIYTLPSMETAVAFRDSLNMVADALPPVTLIGGTYRKASNEPLDRGHIASTISIGCFLVPELGTIVQIMANQYYGDDQKETMRRVVEEANKVTTEELVLPHEYRVTRPLTYLLQEAGVTWEVRCANEQDFGTPEYNLAEYFEVE